MKHVIFLVILLSFTCRLLGITLGDRFQEARAGDFVVYAHDKHVTLFHILAVNSEQIVIEEITAQERFANQVPLEYKNSWHGWVQKGAPEHRAWILSSFQRDTFQLISTYSFDTHEMIPTEDSFAFLPTLFTLSMEKVPTDQRKLIGVPPMPGEPDHRLIWNPRIAFEGEERKLPAVVYRVSVPKDVPDVGGKKLDLYFPEGNECLDYLPYWIEVTGGIVKVKLRAIDSGKNLRSPAASSAL